MVPDGVPKLPRAVIESLFNDLQKPLVHTESHLRILLKKIVNLISFKRVNFGRLYADSFSGVNTIVDHCRPAERKSGLNGSDTGRNFV